MHGTHAAKRAKDVVQCTNAGLAARFLALLLLFLGLDDFGAPRDLQRLLFAHALLVCSNVPQVRRRKTGVALLDAHLFVDTLLHVLDLGVNGLEARGVRALAVRTQQLDVVLIQRHNLVLVLRIGVRLAVRLPVLLGRHWWRQTTRVVYA